MTSNYKSNTFVKRNSPRVFCLHRHYMLAPIHPSIQTFVFSAATLSRENNQSIFCLCHLSLLLLSVVRQKHQTSGKERKTFWTYAKITLSFFILKNRSKREVCFCLVCWSPLHKGGELIKFHPFKGKVNGLKNSLNKAARRNFISANF